MENVEFCDECGVRWPDAMALFCDECGNARHKKDVVAATPFPRSAPAVTAPSALKKSSAAGKKKGVKWHPETKDFVSHLAKEQMEEARSMREALRPSVLRYTLMEDIHESELEYILLLGSIVNKYSKEIVARG